MLNLNQLRVFYHAAKNLNYTAAAAELFITQPAVTAQMKAFEEFCKLKLFRKRGRNLFLTDEGLALYGYAEKIFNYEKEIESAIEDMHELKRGVLSLGTTKAYARYFMPLMLSTFHDNYPDIKIQLYEGSSLDMIYSLLDFKNEVAVIAKAEDLPEVNFYPFSKEEMAVIVAPERPLSRKKAVSFKELAHEPFIMKENGSGTRKLVEQSFANANCEPNILMETSNTEFIKQLVQRGDGISIVVKEAVALELEDQPLSPPARAFVDTLTKLRSEEIDPMGISAMMVKILAQRRKAS